MVRSVLIGLCVQAFYHRSMMSEGIEDGDAVTRILGMRGDGGELHSGNAEMQQPSRERDD